jgi:peptide/nickel transport system substrate-binding protein
MEGLYLLGSGGPQLDADYVMGNHIDGKRRGLYFNTPETDQLIQAAASELDTAKRQSIYDDLQSKLHDLAPWIFLYQLNDLYGVKKTLTWTPTPDERIWVYGMKA